MTVSGIVAIIRMRSEPVTDELIAALVAGGVTCIEATLPTPGSLEAVTRWRDRDDAELGIGTIRLPEHVHAAADAGARFLVTPATSPAVIAAAAERGLPILSGALTPTEIELAWGSGASMVKVFPIETVGGADYLRAVAAPLDDIPLVPTGGVTPETAEVYARLGCPAVGAGSALVSERSVADRDWSGITQRARDFAAAWERGRRG